MAHLSIIIPIDKNEFLWVQLLEQLKTLGPVKEVILSALEPAPQNWGELTSHYPSQLIWIHNKTRGRSYQMNEGAKHSTGLVLWFLHCDSWVHPQSLMMIEKAIQSKNRALFYFDLRFHSKLNLIKINEFGVWIRCRFFNLPFGDQAFCIEKKLFEELNGFNKNIIIGEDLELITRCHQFSIPVLSIQTWIQTSARKYETRGWLKTTYQHLKMTYQLLKKFKDRKRPALAVFVKTLGYSQVKTRLAKTKGQNFAEQFYKNSLACVREMLLKLNKDIKIYWAVAESKQTVCSFWTDFHLIEQGQGMLGDRLDFVYSELLKNHDQVILIGSDSPHLHANVIKEAVQLLEHFDYVVGPALDGGFYLLAGKKQISSETWKSVPYSTDQTLQKLIEKLTVNSKLTRLEPTFDVDEEEDLIKLKDQLESNSQISNPQKKLLQLIQQI